MRRGTPSRGTRRKSRQSMHATLEPVSSLSGNSVRAQLPQTELNTCTSFIEAHIQFSGSKIGRLLTEKLILKSIQYTVE